jgi:hypothetical protein
MSQHTSALDEQQFEILSGFLDGELTQQEAQKVVLQIETDPEYQKLYEELAMMRQQVQSLSLQEQELEHLDKLFEEPVAKQSRWLGFGIFATSATVLVAYTLFRIFTNPELPMIEKVLVGGLCGGGLLLFLSVLRQRMISSKNDKYNRVKL